MAVGRRRNPPRADPAPRVSGPAGVWLSNGKPVNPVQPSRDPRATKRRVLPEEGMDPWRRWRLAVSCLEHRLRTVYYFHEEHYCDQYRGLALHALCAFAHPADQPGASDR